MENKTIRHTIAVIGAGSWGTALAVLLAKNGQHVHFWGRNKNHLETLNKDRCNKQYLPGIDFPENLLISSNLQSCIEQVTDILLVVPSSGIRKTLDQIKTHCDSKMMRIAIASKGLEQTSLKLLHEVVYDVFGDTAEVCIISGPTFALEVANNLPTAITVASSNTEYAQQFATYLSNDHFRAYTSSDVIGVEIGGAIKNIMAIAAGIADGLGFGANTRAALITRALVEISRLNLHLGGRPETLMGMAGLGDLILTCTDNQSRNRRVGLGLAKGHTLAEIQLELGQVAEGIATTEKIYHLSKKSNIDMPIVQEIYNVLYSDKKPVDAVRALLARDAGSEVS